MKTAIHVRRFLGYVAGDGAAYLLNAVVFIQLLHQLSKVNYGYYALAASVAVWVSQAGQFGMAYSAVRLISNDPGAWRSITRSALSLRLLMCAGLLVASVGALPLIHSRALGLLILAYMPLHIANALQLDFVHVAFGRAWQISSSRLLAAAVFLAGVLLFVREDTPLWYVPLIQAAGVLLSLVPQYAGIYGRPPCGAHVAAVRAPSRRELFHASVPVTVAQFVVIGYCSVDVIMLGILLMGKPDIVGEYAAAVKLIQLAAMPQAALLAVLAPLYSRGFAASDPVEFREAERLYRWGNLGLGALGAAAFFLFGGALLELMSGHAMPVSRATFHIVAVSYLIMGLHAPYSTVLPYMNATRPYLAVHLIALGVGLAGHLILIPLLGYQGAAIAWLVSVSTLLLVSAWAYRQHVRNAVWRVCGATAPE